MKMRLLLAAFCILVLPMCFLSSKSGKLTNSAPFATVVFAGHTTLGGWCECGAPGCLCDPTEEITSRTTRPASDATPVQHHAKARLGRVSELDLGSSAIMLALALFVWSRMRA